MANSKKKGTCSSIAILDSISLKLARKGLDTMKKHVDVARSSYDEPLKLTRTVEEFVEFVEKIDAKHLTYQEILQNKELTLFNCHHGQKKLVMSLLEFVAEALKALKVPQRDLIVVYPGASGLAVAVAMSIFKEVTFYLYDPAPNTVDLIPANRRSEFSICRTKASRIEKRDRVTIFTDKAGFFDDAEALKFAAFPNVLLVSDVRMVNREVKIAEDMRNQQRWAVLCGAVGYMFKFRIPYQWNAEIADCYDVRHLKNANPAAKIQIVKSSGSGIPYLDGRLFIQLYPKATTAELRLIGFAPKQLSYKVKTYDVKEIEDALALFNAVYRSHAVYKAGRHSGSYFRERDLFPGYEVVAEYEIATKIQSALGGSKTVEMLDSIIREIDKNLVQYRLGMESCVKRTFDVDRTPEERKSSNVVARAIRDCGTF